MIDGNVMLLLKSPVVWLLLMLVAALMVVGQMDYEDAVLAERHYCDMVERFEKSGGEYGYPPYNPDIDCSNSNAN